MEIFEYLINEKEEMPKWLKQFKPGDKINKKELFASRVVYYPGAGLDGQAVKTFNLAHYAHVYIYADYLKTKQRCINETSKLDAFKGYHLLHQQELQESDLINKEVVYHVKPDVVSEPLNKNEVPYCLLSIFERNKDYDDSHGAERFVLIELFADAIAAYDALFGNKNIRIDAAIIQDHGFSGNYDRFGKGGLMEEIAKITSTYPKYIACRKDNIWDNYDLIENLQPVIRDSFHNYLHVYNKK